MYIDKNKYLVLINSQEELDIAYDLIKKEIKGKDIKRFIGEKYSFENTEVRGLVIYYSKNDSRLSYVRKQNIKEYKENKKYIKLNYNLKLFIEKKYKRKKLKLLINDK